MTDIEKMDLRSMDIVEEKLSSLKELFPEVFTEGQKIDFERLKLALGRSVDVGKERYGMNWPGKADCFKIIQQPSIATLTPAREESVDFNETENLFIEGDNLEVLKLLQKSYLGKVKVIEIDPPYNTGSDFIYPDNYSESLDTYLRYTGQIDDEGRKYSTNTEADGRFHSKWLNMMYPRLFLARNLLREDGVIFIHIDDHEASNLRKVCDEIFGEENFVGVFSWRSRTAKADVPFGVSCDVEWILAFAKSTNFIAGRIGERHYYKTDDYVDRWRLQDLTKNTTKSERINSFFTMINPRNGENFPASETRTWSVTIDTFGDYYKKGKIVFPGDYDFLNIKRPAFRVFEREDKEKAILKYGTDDVKMSVSTYLPEKEIGRTEHGTKEIRELFEQQIFPYPKPTTLVKYFIENISDPDAIILDFFSGSATTAHAILAQNKEDGGNRKFIMVQLPEPCTSETDAFKAGHKTIADIGKERIRRVIKKIREEQAQNEDLFSADKPKLDLGFKVFKLEPSNFKLWNDQVAKEKDAIKNQLEMFVEHINPQSSQEDILYELLLKSGFPLSTKIAQLSFADKTVFSIDEGAMLICLEKDLTPEVIKAMADKNPVRVICLDEGFHGNDQLKTNAVQIMKSRDIKFRTV